MFFSIIIPIFNRPDELDELLKSMTLQNFDKNLRFEVIIIEDGSTNKADIICSKYHSQLDIKYFYKENAGQGFARNTGFEKANGDYFIVFDSDCIIPPNYLQTVYDFLQINYLDAFGGPDAAHESFTPVQKAISYAMTSLFSTGGIRGNKNSAEKFRPRSFNMGISRKVWEITKGYKITRMGEDIEFSIRIEKAGFKTGLIADAFVYHKRRTDFSQFYKQLHFFGRGRINIRHFFPEELKLVHLFPAVFILYLCFSPILLLFSVKLCLWHFLSILFYFSVIFFDALRKTKNIEIAFLSIFAVFIQLSAYGLGFLKESLSLVFNTKNIK